MIGKVAGMARSLIGHSRSAQITSIAKKTEKAMENVQEKYHQNKGDFRKGVLAAFLANLSVYALGNAAGLKHPDDQNNQPK